MNQTTLTNFNVPYHIRKRFDEVCHASGRTRTSVLVEMMETFTLWQGKVLAAKNEQFHQVDQTLQESRRIMGFKDFLAEQSDKGRDGVQTLLKSEFELPSPFMSDGQEEW